MKALGPLNFLDQPLQLCWLEIDTLAGMDPWYTKRLYQCAINGLLNWIMYLFFLIHSLQLLAFSFLFLGVSSVLLCTIFQHVHHMDMRWVQQESAFSYCHLHYWQSHWPFQWIHCVPHTVCLILDFYFLLENALWALCFLVNKSMR